MEAILDDVVLASNVSTYSLKALVDAFGPLMPNGGSLVLDFDALLPGRVTTGWASPRLALESTSRYLARDSASARSQHRVAA